MVNYGKSIIYKLCCKDINIDKIYVGSTVNFSRRKAQHKLSVNNIKYNKIKLYQFILNNGGWENWDMIEIMKYPCNDKRELEKKENEIMKELKAELNSQTAFNTEEERKEYQKKYIEENKETKKEKDKKHYEENKDKIKKQNKIWRENNIGYYENYNKDYYEENKNKLNEKQKKYNEENKEKIKEREKQKIICECGCEINKYILSRHKQTKKHIKLMEEKNINFD